MRRCHRQAYCRAKKRIIKTVREGLGYLRKQIARIRRTECWIKKKMQKVGMEQRALLKARLENILTELRDLLLKVKQQSIYST